MLWLTAPRRWSSTNSSKHSAPTCEAFVLTQVLGFSYADAAVALDCPVGTIRSRVFRAREALVDALAIDGWDERYVFQGVHMLLEGNADRPGAPGEARRNRLVFIGRNLDRAELEAGVRACLA